MTILIIIMDIDQVITNNVDDLLNHPVDDNELVTYGQWWDNNSISIRQQHVGIDFGF